jgi:hypothetical protein
VIKLTEKHAYRGITWIPGKFKDVEKLINAKEKERGGSLTDDERKEIINMFVAKEVKKQINAKKKGRGRSLTDDERKKRINMLKAEYLEIKGMLAPISLEVKHEDEKGDTSYLLSDQKHENVFDFTDRSNSPGINSEKICGAVEYVLREKRRLKTRACNRALFTVYCIKNMPGHWERLAPALDTKILSEYFITQKEPSPPATYMKYHPNVTKGTAATKASEDTAKFIEDLESFLKKHSKIFGK